MDTSKIELRTFSLDYAKELFELVDRNRAYLRQTLPWLDNNTKVEDSEDFIKKTLEKPGHPRLIFFEGQLVGIVGMHHVYEKEKKFEIGYWLSEDMQGKGIITHAVEKVIELMFADGYETAVIRCDPANVKSAAIPQRLGFAKTGLIKDGAENYGQKIDLEVWEKYKI